MIYDVSSNYRELRIWVEALKKYVREGKLRDCEVFLVTDNLVVANHFYNGYSSSYTLFNLILRLHKLELEGKDHPTHDLYLWQNNDCVGSRYFVERGYSQRGRVGK